MDQSQITSLTFVLILQGELVKDGNLLYSTKVMSFPVVATVSLLRQVLGFVEVREERTPDLKQGL